jgi:hypothetical protein
VKIKDAKFETKFCEGILNPADHVSRGIKASNLELSNWGTDVFDANLYKPIVKEICPPELQTNQIYIN